MSETVAIRLIVNGTTVERGVQPRLNLVDFLRDELGLTGTHWSCEHGACGACTVRVDGEIVRGCLIFAAQLDGATVETIEGLTESGALAELQAAFHARNAVQCGFCTAGMLLTADALLRREPDPTRETIRAALSANYCRCTGYHAIVDAVADAARERAKRP
ncbi:MAG: (2Fe-2S)-binding protein [Alphaproteobacteria bacterium]|nr:(2Fe-2S)-binding protein [Alphaproteobacteria bacterium]MDE1969844.1 (2Fe-2S)-binding protein [Alphaproteobacteria bacterium]